MLHNFCEENIKSEASNRKLPEATVTRVATVPMSHWKSVTPAFSF